MKICGLDLSLKSTGLSVMGDGLDALLTISAGMKGYQRWDHLRVSIMERVEESSLVVMENIYSGTTMSQQELVQFHGVMQFCLWKKGIPFVLVAPSILKKFVTGKGNAEKSMMLREVFRRWDIDAANDNEADAAGLSRIGLCLMGEATAENDAQRDVVAKIQPQLQTKNRAA